MVSEIYTWSVAAHLLHKSMIYKLVSALLFPLYDCHYVLVGGALLLQHMKRPRFIDQPLQPAPHLPVNVCLPFHNYTEGGHPTKLPKLVHAQMSLCCERAPVRPCVRPDTRRSGPFYLISGIDRCAFAPLGTKKKAPLQLSQNAHSKIFNKNRRETS